MAVEDWCGEAWYGTAWRGQVWCGAVWSGLAVEARTGGVSSGLDRFDRLRYGSYV